MLGSKVAQKIADEVMSGLGYNINVMNEQAIIIGSGIKERIGTFHETAMQSIKNCKTYEVTEKDAMRLQGVKAGINMPIVGKEGKVLGAVGITGKPDEVRNIGKLVKMAAELIIEQEESINKFYKHRNDKELFVTTLLSENLGMSEEDVIRWGHRIGYDMQCPRIACIIAFDQSLQKEGEPLKLEKYIDEIKRSAGHSKQDISLTMSGGYILIFKKLTSTEPWIIEKIVKNYFENIFKIMEPSIEEKTLIYVGNYHRDIDGYKKSYHEARSLFKGVFSKQEKGIIFSHRHLMHSVYEGFGKENEENILLPYIKKIETAFGKGTEDAILTMEKLLENGFHYEKTAKDLYLHKNTVIFRKKKMEGCLNIDAKNSINDLLLMKLITYHYLK